MKIKNNCTVIEMTSEEASKDLELYQADMISELVHSELGGSSNHLKVCAFMLKMLRCGEDSDWFQDLIEKHGVPWVPTPNGWKSLGQLITEYPGIFGVAVIIDDLADKHDNFNENNFEVYLDNVKLDSKKIWENL